MYIWCVCVCAVWDPAFYLSKQARFFGKLPKEPYLPLLLLLLLARQPNSQSPSVFILSCCGFVVCFVSVSQQRKSRVLWQFQFSSGPEKNLHCWFFSRGILLSSAVVACLLFVSSVTLLIFLGSCPFLPSVPIFTFITISIINILRDTFSWSSSSAILDFLDSSHRISREKIANEQLHFLFSGRTYFCGWFITIVWWYFFCGLHGSLVNFSTPKKYPLLRECQSIFYRVNSESYLWKRYHHLLHINLCNMSSLSSQKTSYINLLKAVVVLVFWYDINFLCEMFSIVSCSFLDDDTKLKYITYIPEKNLSEWNMALIFKLVYIHKFLYKAIIMIMQMNRERLSLIVWLLIRPIYFFIGA